MARFEVCAGPAVQLGRHVAPRSVFVKRTVPDNSKSAKLPNSNLRRGYKVHMYVRLRGGARLRAGGSGAIFEHSPSVISPFFRGTSCILNQTRCRDDHAWGWGCAGWMQLSARFVATRRVCRRWEGVLLRGSGQRFE